VISQHGEAFGASIEDLCLLFFNSHSSTYLAKTFGAICLAIYFQTVIFFADYR
jgi:hypothetical protein